mgnify:CR=1 FL=1
MDQELKEYSDKQFKISEIIGAGFTFISIGFAFMILGISLYYMGLTGYGISNLLTGILLAVFGLIMYLKAESFAKRRGD